MTSDQEPTPAPITFDTFTAPIPDIAAIECTITTTEAVSPGIMEEGIQNGEVPPAFAQESGLSMDIPETTHKGTINLILLAELIKKECGRPNIYTGDIHNTAAYYARVTGCNPKNIVDKTKYYRSREGIHVNTANIRSTHRKYLELLLTHYQEIVDDTLYRGAEDLQSFIETQGIRKK